MTTHQNTIFVVDDTPANLKVLFEYLKGAGFEVLVATQAEDALETINQTPPDLILLDILMPEIDGFETCRRLKADEATRDIPIIFMTALDDTVDEVKGLKLGAVDYITKPFQVETVLARIRTHLALRDMQKELEEKNAQLHQENIERKQAEEALQQRNRRLSLLNRLSHMFSSSLDLKDVLETALGEIQRLLDAFSTSFWLIDPETNELVCMHTKGPGSDPLLNWRLAPGQGITGWAFEHNESLLVSDTWSDERHFKEVDEQTGVTVRSMISIPLRVKGKVIGILNLVDSRVEHFTQNDLLFLEPIAAEAAIAIENARLYMIAQQEIAERKQAEGALRESEERYRSLVECSPVPVVVHSEEKFVFLNPEAIRTLGGTSPEDFLGKSIWDVVHPDYQHIVKQRVKKIYKKKGSAQLLEEKFIRLDGKIIDVEAIGSITNYMGKPASQVVFRDISELKQTERVLHRFQLLLEKVFASLEEVVFVLDPATCTILLCNSAVERIFGYNEQEVFGRTPEFLHEDQVIYNFLVEDLFHALDAKEVFRAESQMCRKDGSILISEHTAMEIVDNSGERTAVIWVIQDISERKRVEKSLAEERNLLRTLIDNLPDLIYVKDAESRFLLANNSMVRSLALKTQDELVGKMDFDFHPLEMAEQYYTDEQAIIESGQPLINREEPVLDQKTGTTHWLLSTKVPFRDSQGNIAGLVSINRDITEQKRAEAELLSAHNELKEKNVQLHELNANKDKFFSIISHDLRSPFNTLLGFAQLLSEHIERYSLDEIKYNIGRIRTSAESLQALLENLLTWSRIQRGVMEYEPEIIDLREVIDDNIDLFTSKAEQKQIVLTCSVQEKMLTYADYNMVNTVIRNLISNALKFTKTGDTIDISAQEQEPHIEIVISDTGTGITQEDLPKLFRIDVQYTRNGTAGEKGTGLGLSLCKDLVEKNGGEIWVESEVGKGTTFRFTLPKTP
jgi:PAS domain S-box-containing protein